MKGEAAPRPGRRQTLEPGPAGLYHALPSLHNSQAHVPQTQPSAQQVWGGTGPRTRGVEQPPDARMLGNHWRGGCDRRCPRARHRGRGAHLPLTGWLNADPVQS